MQCGSCDEEINAREINFAWKLRLENGTGRNIKVCWKWGVDVEAIEGHRPRAS